MTMYLFAVLIGIVAGSRTFTAPAAASWAAHLGRLDLGGTWLAFMGFAWTPWVFTALALVELVVDQLPTTPSRLVPMQFSARLVSGAVSGASVVGATRLDRRRSAGRDPRRRYRHVLDFTRCGRSSRQPSGVIRRQHSSKMHSLLAGRSSSSLPFVDDRRRDRHL